MTITKWKKKCEVACPFCGKTVLGSIRWRDDSADKIIRKFPTPEGHPYAWPESAIINSDEHNCPGIQNILSNSKSK